MRLLALPLAALLLTSCGSEMPVEGTMTIVDSSGVAVEPPGSSACEGTSGYDDLAAGANVVVRDADGKKVALGLLMPGEIKDDGSCVFAFEVPDVPGGDELYSISIGNRDPYDFKKSEAGSLELTIGG